MNRITIATLAVAVLAGMLPAVCGLAINQRATWWQALVMIISIAGAFWLGLAVGR